MVRVALGVCLGLLVSGCAGAGPPVTVAFDPAHAAFAKLPGTGRVEGEAFLRRDYGRPVTAAGERVFLIPATPYAVQRFGSMFGGDRRAYYPNELDPPPDAYFDGRRESKVDMRGRFLFEKVPPGPYIVATRVFWTEPKSFITFGGAIYDTVNVQNDETVSVIVSGK